MLTWLTFFSFRNDSRIATIKCRVDATLLTLDEVRHIFESRTWNHLLCDGASLPQNIYPLHSLCLLNGKTWKKVIPKKRKWNLICHDCHSAVWQQIMTQHEVATMPRLWCSEHTADCAFMNRFLLICCTTSPEQDFLQHFSLIVWNLQFLKNCGHLESF